MKGYLFEFLLIINEFPVTTKRTLYTKMMKTPRAAGSAPRRHRYIRHGCEYTVIFNRWSGLENYYSLPQ